MKKILLFALATFWGCLSIFAQNNFNTNTEFGFQENLGQMTDMNGRAVPNVLFKIESSGVQVWLTKDGLTFQTISLEKRENTTNKNALDTNNKKYEVNWERIDMELRGASILKEKIIKEKPSFSHSNFFTPNHPEGIYNVKKFQKLIIQDVYEGIDWVLYQTKKGGFKYDFVVHPDGNYKEIQLVYRSKSPIKINEDGRIKMTTQYGEIEENAPVSFYQGKKIKTDFHIVQSKQIQINDDAGYETSVVFHFKGLPTHLEDKLVIDPELVWCTIFPGWDILHRDLHTDVFGNVFITGITVYTNFPLFDPGGGTYFQGYLGSQPDGYDDVHIIKFDNDGVLLWSTLYVGSEEEAGYSITSDEQGNIFVAGTTRSDDFPIFDAGGGAYFDDSKNGQQDVFLLKFDNNGIREWATYYGGNKFDLAPDLAVDFQGNLFLAMTTSSNNFPLLNAGSGTYFDETLDGSSDFLITKFTSEGIQQWATYYGGTGSSLELAESICTDPSGNLYIIGQSSSPDLTLQNPGGDTYFQNYNDDDDLVILKFSNDGNLLWSTNYGGSSREEAFDILSDSKGNIYAYGRTQSIDLPVFDPGGSAFFDDVKDEGFDAFIVKFNDDGERLWATYYGGNGDEIHSSDISFGGSNASISPCDELYIVFQTDSDNLPSLLPCEGGFIDDEFGIPAISVIGEYDVHLARFNEVGIIEWATYFGGDQLELGGSISVDLYGNLFMANILKGYNFFSAESLPLTDPGAGVFFDAGFSVGGFAISQGCVSKFSFISEEVIFDQSQTNDDLCNCSGTATAIITDGCSPYTFNWSTGTTVIDTLGLGIHTETNLCGGDYWVEIISNCNQLDTLFYTIEFDLCELVVNIKNDTICAGDCAYLSAEVYYAEGDITFDWGNGILSNSNEVEVCPKETTTYQVISKDDLTSDTTLVTVFVKPPPIIDLGPDIALHLGDSVQLNALVDIPTTQISSITWTPSESINCDTCLTTITTPLFPTEFTIDIIYLESCIASNQIFVDVIKERNIYIPNAFTPLNQDGYNDIFYIFSDGKTVEKVITFKVFNRWGALVFERNNFMPDDPSFGWDGYFNGELMNSSVLVYFAEIEFIDGEKIIYKGDVTIVP